MPRTNAPRNADQHLAARIAYERERLGWSYASLAKRMTDEGCAINQSALYKIEKGSPRRTVSFTEARTLARLFKMPLEELSVPPALLINKKAVELVQAVDDKAKQLNQAALDLKQAGEALAAYLHAHPGADPAVRQYLQAAKGMSEESADYYLLVSRGRDAEELRRHREKYRLTVDSERP